MSLILTNLTTLTFDTLALAVIYRKKTSHSYNDQKKMRDFTFIFLLEYVLIKDSFFCGDTFGSEVSPASSEFELSQSNKELYNFCGPQKTQISWFHVHFSSRICSYQVLNIFVVIRLVLNFSMIQTDLNYFNRTKSYRRFSERPWHGRCCYNALWKNIRACCYYELR